MGGVDKPIYPHKSAPELEHIVHYLSSKQHAHSLDIESLEFVQEFESSYDDDEEKNVENSNDCKWEESGQ